jgi:N-acetylneuraminic acid mutarotase
MTRIAAVACLALMLPAAPARATVSRGWVTTGSLGVARGDHEAVLLDDGRVLVAGGFVNNTAVASTELYDPATGKWSPAAPMRTARAAFGMVKLANGQVLAAGGYRADGQSTTTAETYNPATNTWTNTANNLAAARGDASIALLRDGRALVAGGTTTNPTDSNLDVYLDSAEVYDPSRRLWSGKQSFGGAGRNGGAAITLVDGRVLYAGGVDGGTGEFFRDAYAFDPVFGKWSQFRIMGTKRTGFTLSPLPGGRALAAGGGNGGAVLNSAEYYDGVASWQPTLPMITPHVYHRATTLPSGQVLVAGGLADTGFPITTELYDPATNAWTLAGAMSTTRVAHSQTLLSDGRVLAAGGYNGGRSAELWWPTTTLTTDPALNFGSTVPGTATGSSVQLTNTGDSPLWADDFALAGADPDEFALSADRCRGPVAPSATCLIDVSFTPSGEGPRSATLTLSANVAGATQAIPLSGVGAGAPARTNPPQLNPPPGPDRDGDGVADATDRCPTLKGASARTGCPTGLLNDPSIRYRPSGKGIRVIAYSVKATSGARIKVTCSRGCKRTIATGRGAKPVVIKGLKNRRLINGTRITVTVTLPGRLTTTVHDKIARARRTEGRPRCTPVAC